MRDKERPPLYTTCGFQICQRWVELQSHLSLSHVPPIFNFEEGGVPLQSQDLPLNSERSTLLIKRLVDEYGVNTTTFGG